MNRFGLERGIKYTRAKHEDIKEFYRKIDDALAYSDKLKEYAVQRDDETEEECIERLISEMSDLAIRNKKLEEEHEEDERKLLALSKKIDEVNRRNDETNELINLAAGNDIGDMVNTVLKHSKNEKMLEILTKVMTWVSSEYEDCKEMMILNGLDEDV